MKSKRSFEYMNFSLSITISKFVKCKLGIAEEALKKKAKVFIKGWALGVVNPHPFFFSSSTSHKPFKRSDYYTYHTFRPNYALF